MKNTDYWQNRFKQLEKAQYNTSAEQIQSIYELFTKSERVIQNKINNWCMRFADNNNITYAEALKLLKNDELKELKWDVNEYIAHGQENSINQKWLKELENASSKVHISYLQSIQLQCRMEIEKLYAEYDDLLNKTVKNAYEERYYKTAYEIQLGTQSGKFLSELDTDLVNDIIHKPWALDEKNFSERIWNDKTKLINTLHNSLTRMCIVGEGPEKAVKEVADKMHVSRQQAAKVVNTEVAAFTAKAQQDCFKELDIEQFEVVETLDSHTCKRCADMDGKHFPMNQYKVGITVPPFHPNCRGCTAPYFDDEFNHTGKRAASDDTGKIYYVPADMSYKEWKKKYLVDNSSIKLQEKYNEYKKILGKNTPDIEEFININYNKKEKKMFKDYVSSINRGELTPLSDFTLYKNISNEMDEKLIGVTTSIGIQITGKSKHSVARVIGSVENRRNGVLIKDVVEALTSKEAKIMPIKTDKNGKSQKFRTKKVEVSINIDTGNIIQVNPIGEKRRSKW